MAAFLPVRNLERNHSRGGVAECNALVLAFRMSSSLPRGSSDDVEGNLSSRREISLLMVLVALGMVLSVTMTRVCGAEEKRPNIVLLMADDQGWGDVGYNGHPHLITPVLDEMAATSLRFDNFYAAAPVCSPTRGSVLTGRHPNRFACFSWGHTLRPQELTIAEILRRVGYRTGHFGKWHLGSVRAESPVNPGRSGFEEWWSSPNFYDNNPLFSHNGRAVEIRGESSLVTVEAAIPFLHESVQSQQPFLAVIWFGNPHSPHEALPELRALYPGFTPAEQNYYGELTGIDLAVGRLRDELKMLGVRDNTLVWYTSDNGGQGKVASVGSLRGRKGDLYDGGVKVPAVIEWPARIREPRATAALASTSDILPTLLDVLGLSMPDDRPIDGVSLVDVLDGRSDSRTRPIGFWVHPEGGIRTSSAEWMQALLDEQAGKPSDFSEPPLTDATLLRRKFAEHDFPGHAAWIDGNWKLHRIPPKNGIGIRLELYDLATDPNETSNVAAEHAERVRHMEAALLEWQRSVIRSLNGADYP